MVCLVLFMINFFFGYNVNAREDQQYKVIKIIDTFTNCTEVTNRLPCGWYATQSDVSMFSIENEEENWFLKIRTKGGNTAIGKKCKLKVSQYPILSWRWRVHKLPDGAKESVKELSDSGAGIYVIFHGIFKMNRVLKYVWSNSLPKGITVSSPYNGRTKIIVLRNNMDKLGEWVWEEVNILDDFRKTFNDEPPRVECIAIMSDSDNTKSLVEADYDDIRIRTLQ